MARHCSKYVNICNISCNFMIFPYPFRHIHSLKIGNNGFQGPGNLYIKNYHKIDLNPKISQDIHS